MNEKPLHVQVALALGCDAWSPAKDVWFCSCEGLRHSELGEKAPLVLRYDTDWSAVGPLIEEYKIELYYTSIYVEGPNFWMARQANYENRGENGETPLIAVCNLMLAMEVACNSK